MSDKENLDEKGDERPQILKFRGKFYHVKDTNPFNKTTYYRCKFYKKLDLIEAGKEVQCLGSVKILQNGNVVVGNPVHRCGFLAEAQELKQEYLKNMENPGVDSAASLYGELAPKYSEEAQILCPHQKVRRQGYRVKAQRKEKSQPTGAFLPKLWSKILSLATFALVLKKDESASIYENPSGSNKLSNKLIPASPSKKTRGRKVQSTVSYDEDFIKNLSTVDHIFVDATFDSTPRIPGVYQLLTIMTFINGKAIPIIWVLMPNKVHGSYVHVWTFLKNTFPNFKPKKCMMDFELAERNSIRQAFPGIIVEGCYFHYARCLWKNAVRKGFALNMCNKIKRPDVHYFIKQMIALALLPVDRIQETYARIKQQAPFTFPNNRGLIRFLSYYEKTWMSEKSRYKPHDFCVYDKIHRTNNAVESYHKRLATIFKKKPTPKVFLLGLQTLMRENRVHCRKTDLGYEFYSPRANRESRIRTAVIRTAWRYSKRADWDSETFVKIVASPKSYDKKDLDDFEYFGPEIWQLLDPCFDNDVDNEWNKRLNDTVRAMLIEQVPKKRARQG